MTDWPLKHDGPCACRFVRREEFGPTEQTEWCGLHAKQRNELDRLRAAMLTAASLLERDGDEHSVGAALRRALNEPAHGADKPVCDMTEQLYAAKVEDCGQLTVQRDYLRNILEHISGTCEGRAVVIARAALVMFPQIHNVTIKFPIEKEEL